MTKLIAIIFTATMFLHGNSFAVEPDVIKPAVEPVCQTKSDCRLVGTCCGCPTEAEHISKPMMRKNCDAVKCALQVQECNQEADCENGACVVIGPRSIQ